jgi:hypothetical protein
VARSVVGPHGIGNCWFSVGTSGHDRYEETAGHHIFPTMTSGSGAARRRVRIPPTPAAGRWPLPTSQASPGRALPCGRAGAYTARPTTVVLAGRATTVPFTTDLSGRKRTPTDIPMGTVTCAVRRQARWRPRPIWLCKQGVSSSRLRPVLLCGDRVEFSSGGATPDRLVKGIGRTVARSVCRSSGHNLGSQRTSLSGALLAATTRTPLSGMGQWPTSWNQSKSRVSMLPPVLAWAETTASPDRSYMLYALGSL